MGILKKVVKTAANMSGLGLVSRQLGVKPQNLMFGVAGVMAGKKKPAPAAKPQEQSMSRDDIWDEMDAEDAANAAKMASRNRVATDDALAEAQRIKKMRMRRLAAQSQG